MKLLKSEQETIISFNAADRETTIYTANQAWINKLDKLVSDNPEEYKFIGETKVKGKVISKKYEFPKKLITLRHGSMKLTKEQRKTRIRNLESSEN